MPILNERLDTKMQQCIQNCIDCHTICLQTIDYCLEKGGKHAGQSHIRLLSNCAEICQTSSDFMLTQSEFHMQTCGVCAEVCESCAESCEAIDPNDKQMKACAEICRKCADSCREMSGGEKRAA